jgi:hypothetical protein
MSTPLVLQAGKLIVGLERAGEGWKVVETDGMKKRAQLPALVKCCEELKTIAETDRAYLGSSATCWFSSKDPSKKGGVLEMIKKDGKKVPPACLALEHP